MWSIPLLAEEGWLRHQIRVCEATEKRRKRGGQLGEVFRPEQFRRADHPGRAVSERIHFYLWRVHPSSARRGIVCSIPIRPYTFIDAPKQGKIVVF